MTLIKQDGSLILPTDKAWQLYCAWEHLCYFEADQPPVVIMVGACKLTDAYKMLDGRRNSEWMRLFKAGGTVMVKIIATGPDRTSCVKFAMDHMRKMNPMPRCNLMGFSNKGVARRVECLTNGEIYDSQTHAATALGISNVQISKHLKGDCKHVNKYVFRYADDAVV